MLIKMTSLTSNIKLSFSRLIQLPSSTRSRRTLTTVSLLSNCFILQEKWIRSNYYRNIETKLKSSWWLVVLGLLRSRSLLLCSKISKKLNTMAKFKRLAGIHTPVSLQVNQNLKTTTLQSFKASEHFKNLLTLKQNLKCHWQATTSLVTRTKVY